jgi:hypothetical protein
MKLKYFYIALLAIVAVNQTYGADEKYKRRAAAPEQVRQHEHVAHQVAPHIDLAGHHNNPVAAIQDINDRIGVTVAGGAHHTANERLTDALGVIGNITDVATAQGALNVPGHLPLAALNPRLEAILNRLKIGLAATAVAGVHVHGVAATKTTNTAAGAIAAGDEAAAAAAADIENFLTEIGW